MVVRTPTLYKLDVREFRHARPSPASIPYEYSDPSTTYSLDLRYPQHRALLRTLLRRCRDSGHQPREMFNFQELPGNVLDPAKACDSKDGLPKHGAMTFSFLFPPLQVSAHKDITSLVTLNSKTRKLKVSLWSFVRLSYMFRQLIDEEARRVLLDAMAADLMLKLCHVKYLSELDSCLRFPVLECLLPTVHNLDRMGGLEMVVNAKASRARSLQASVPATFGLLLFNLHCPSGNYAMDMVVPADRRVLELLLLVNEWDRHRAMALGMPDLSQHGGHECVRNATLEGRGIEWHSSEFAFPSGGMLSLDYVSPFRPPKDCEPSGQALLDKIRTALQSSACEATPKVLVLRTMLHLLVLTPEQCWELVTVFPGETHPHLVQRFSARVEAYVAMFGRCIRPADLLSAKPCGLYGLSLFKRGEVLKVRFRLGRLRTFNLLLCDEFRLTPGARARSLAERLATGLLDHEGNRWRLQDLRLLDDPTSIADANKYTMDLSIHEDWAFTKLLLTLAKLEKGEHLDEPSWSEMAHLEERGTRWLVPPEWHKEVPRAGIFSVRFFTEKREYRDMALRQSLAEKFLGW